MKKILYISFLLIIPFLNAQSSDEVVKKIVDAYDKRLKEN